MSDLQNEFVGGRQHEGVEDVARALLERWVAFTFARIGANWQDATLVEETREYLRALGTAK